MEKKYKDNILAIRMYTGEDLTGSLIEAFAAVPEPLGIVVSCVGMIKEAEHGYFEGGGQYRYCGFKEPREIVSLTGNIVKTASDTYVHLHAGVAGSDAAVRGGHLKSARVHGTAEVMLLLSGIGADRAREEETGLKGLKL